MTAQKICELRVDIIKGCLRNYALYSRNVTTISILRMLTSLVIQYCYAREHFFYKRIKNTQRMLFFVMYVIVIYVVES